MTHTLVNAARTESITFESLGSRTIVRTLEADGATDAFTLLTEKAREMYREYRRSGFTPLSSTLPAPAPAPAPARADRVSAEIARLTQMAAQASNPDYADCLYEQIAELTEERGVTTDAPAPAGMCVDCENFPATVEDLCVECAEYRANRHSDNW